MDKHSTIKTCTPNLRVILPTLKALLATKAVGAKYCVFHSLVFLLYGKKDIWEEGLDFNSGAIA